MEPTPACTCIIISLSNSKSGIDIGRGRKCLNPASCKQVIIFFLKSISKQNVSVFSYMYARLFDIACSQNIDLRLIENIIVGKNGTQGPQRYVLADITVRASALTPKPPAFLHRHT